MNILFKHVLIIFILLSSVYSFAGWTGIGKVEGIYSHNGYHVVVTTIIDNPCGTAGKFYWPITDPDAKDMLAIALTALTTEKNVRLFFNDSQTACLWSGELASHMLILK